jgi:tetratricopeptide (TPR) repeat protein
LASGLIYEKEKEEARKIYLEMLKLDPNNSMTWHYLALNYYNLEQYSKAEESIKKAIELDNLYAINHYILGLILEKKENYLSATQAYQEAIKRDSRFIESYNNLGNIYLRERKLNKAIEVYEMALKVSPTSFRAYIYEKIANVYDVVGNQLLVALYLAYSAFVSNKSQVAISYFEQFLTNHTDNLDAYLKLGFCYIRTDRASSATILIENALKLFPNNPSLERFNQSILPVIYRNIEEITFYRERFSQLLKKLIKNISLDTPQEQNDAFCSILICTNFYLGYQGKNDLKIQKEYAEYAYRIIKKLYPQWCKIIPLEEKNKSEKSSYWLYFSTFT